jgi:NADH:ubiquinone oxidoreductase subunit 3 (subunit A)
MSSIYLAILITLVILVISVISVVSVVSAIQAGSTSPAAQREALYNSGALLRSKSEPDAATEMDLDTNRFARRELNYYLRR